MKRGSSVALAVTLVLPAVAQAQQKEVDELLAADRSCSTASAITNVVSGLTPMFASWVVMPTPQGVFANGIAEVTEALKANPANLTSKAEWTPIRGGISADGQHGFTFGYMTLHHADGTTTPLKYLSYWMKEGGQWKVAAYRRIRRPPGDVSMALMPPSLPVQMVPHATDTARTRDFTFSLAQAEQAFSDEAGVIGLGPAFEKYGRPDAVNMGRDASFTFGNVAIARGVGGPSPTQRSNLSWAANYRVMVASSGDLGVSIGYIRDRTNPSAAPIPFFTIWRRDSIDAPWRYIAE